MPSDYLAVAAIFRNEAPFLTEWLRFHRTVGVDHFFLYDNGSTDHPERVLAPFVEQGCVTVQPWPIPFHQRAQVKAYAECVARARGRTRWLAFLDLDEFLFSPQGVGLRSVLREFEGHPGVVVNWQVYGSSGEEVASERPVIARFTHRAPTSWVRNRKIKSIVDPAAVLDVGVHHCVYRNAAHAVNEQNEAVRLHPRFLNRRMLRVLCRLVGPARRWLDPYGCHGMMSSVSCSLLRINHYAVKSREEFARKVQLMDGKRRYEKLNYFAYHDRNEVFDPILWRYLPAVAEDECDAADLAIDDAQLALVAESS